MKKSTFLGGTCNNSTWRNKLIPLLNVPYFNPVVEDWTPEDQKNELREKGMCKIHLYIITKEMIGVFSIAEAVASSMMRNKITIFQVMPEGFDKSQLKSLEAVIDLIDVRGGVAFVDSSLHRTAAILNNI